MFRKPKPIDVPTTTPTNEELKKAEMFIQQIIYRYRGGIRLSPRVITSHGELSGLDVDDHTQYALADKTRPSPWIDEGDVPVLSDEKYPNALLLDASRMMTSNDLITNLNAQYLNYYTSRSFINFLGMLPAYFSATEKSISTSEDTVIQNLTIVPDTQRLFYIPSFSAYYRWSDLAGGNPTCTLKFRVGLSPEGASTPITYTDKNPLRFQGVDLFMHPVALVRAIVDPADYSEYADGYTNRRVYLQVRAVTDAGTVVFGDKSLSGAFGRILLT